MRRVVVAVFPLLTLYAAVRGDYRVGVQLSSYSNPSHRHYSGGCCDFPHIPFLDTCLGDCDNYFVVCVWEQGDEYAFCRHTGDLGSDDNITFTSSVGRLQNPILLSVTGPWTRALRVAVFVYDRDDIYPATIDGDEFIDAFLLTSPTNGLVTLQGLYGRATMILSMTVSCSQDFYGSDCSVFCWSDSNTHTCDSGGGWVCVDGWTGDYCDECVPYPNCFAVGGYCEIPGQCLCHYGYAGELCDIPITSPTSMTTGGTTTTTGGTTTTTGGTTMTTGGTTMTTEPSTTMTTGTTEPSTTITTGTTEPSTTMTTGTTELSTMTTGTTEPSTTGTTEQSTTMTTGTTEPSTTMTTGTTGPLTTMTTGPSTTMTTGATGLTTDPLTTVSTRMNPEPSTATAPDPLTNAITEPTGLPEVEAQQQSEGGNVVGVVGGVVGGVVILILLASLVLGAMCCLYRQRRRKNGGDSDTHSLVQPLVGENPMYIDNCMGSHVQLESRDYHQFTNPLYRVSSGPTSAEDRHSTAGRSSPIYAYPRLQGCRLASVYLPGDSSPPTGSLSSQRQTPAASTARLPADYENSEQHYEQQPVDWNNDGDGDNITGSSTQGGRLREDGDEGLREEGDVITGNSTTQARGWREFGYVARKQDSPLNDDNGHEREHTQSLSSQYFQFPLNSVL